MKKAEVQLETAAEQETKPKVILEAEVEKPPEGGDLTRSIDTLAKLVDQSHVPQAEVKEEMKLEQKSTRRPTKRGYLGMLIAFVLGLCSGIVAGYGLWGQRVEVEIDNTGLILNSVISPTVKPEATPTPAMAEQKRTDLKIKVLNGTGGKGVAAAGKIYLESLGYSNVETGNAKRTDYVKTEVVLAKAKSGYWSMLKKDLEARYSVIDGFTTDEDVLASAGGVDAVVIVGEE